MLTEEELLAKLAKHGRYYEEHYKDPGFGRGPCTKGWLVKYAESSKEYVVSLSEAAGNYAGGESKEKRFKSPSRALAYTKKIEEHCHKLMKERNNSR